MTEGTLSRKLRSSACVIGCWLGLAVTVSAAEIQMQVQAAPAQPSAVSPTGKLLTIEDAVRIGLDNHPRIRSASERVGSQQAVLGQQMLTFGLSARAFAFSEHLVNRDRWLDKLTRLFRPAN